MFNATYVIYKVSYVKQILPFCSAEKRLSSAIKLLFRTFLSIDSATGNIWDNKRYLNNILYCRCMYNEQFAKNHEAIVHSHREIQQFEWMVSKQIFLKKLISFTTIRVTIVAYRPQRVKYTINSCSNSIEYYCVSVEYVSNKLLGIFILLTMLT